jgi:hypothetical protein
LTTAPSGCCVGREPLTGTFPAYRRLSRRSRCRVSRNTRPMKCPMRGRQPGHHTTPASSASERVGRQLLRSCPGRRAGAEAETSASRQRQPSAVPARCSRLTRRPDTRSLVPPRDSRNNPCRRQGERVVAPTDACSSSGAGARRTGTRGARIWAKASAGTRRRLLAGSMDAGRTSSLLLPKSGSIAVKAARKLTLWRRSKIDPPRARSVGGGGWGAGEVAVFEAVAVAFESHQGNAGLNYRSVLRCEAGPADAELYRGPRHRRRSRRVQRAGESDQNV